MAFNCAGISGRAELPLMRLEARCLAERLIALLCDGSYFRRRRDVSKARSSELATGRGCSIKHRRRISGATIRQADDYRSARHASRRHGVTMGMALKAGAEAMRAISLRLPYQIAIPSSLSPRYYSASDRVDLHDVATRLSPISRIDAFRKCL